MIKTCGRLAASWFVLHLFVFVIHSNAAEPIKITENGGWCWFQGERAVVSNGKVILTSIAGSDAFGPWNAGDLVAASLDLTTKRVEHFVLHASFQRDDHAVAGLCILPDNRLLAVYGKHGSDALQRWRMTTSAADISAWTKEQTFDVGANYTYSNVYRLSAEANRLYNFHRGRGFNPNCTLSDDGGETWRYGWRLVDWNRSDLLGNPHYTGMDGRRPYVCYASDGVDTIHFLMTEDHPRAYDNSIYHGYYRNGKLHRSDGTALASLNSEKTGRVKPHDFTQVFPGNADQVAWSTDIHIDSSGDPFVAFSVQVGDADKRSKRSVGGEDHRYYFARWDGSQWNVHFMAHAGTKLYTGEEDYTGLVALDPDDPSQVVISTNSHPETGEALISSSDQQRHWELFQGVSADGGASWKWLALTENSTEDQLRPVIPSASGNRRVILWCRGKLRTYTDYRLEIVGLIQDRESPRS